MDSGLRWASRTKKNAKELGYGCAGFYGCVKERTTAQRTVLLCPYGQGEKLARNMFSTRLSSEQMGNWLVIPEGIKCLWKPQECFFLLRRGLL